MTADNTVMDKLKHLVGLQHETEREQRMKMGSQHLKNSEEAALEAAYNAYLALKDGAAVAADVTGESLRKNAKIAAQKSGELYRQSADYIAEKSSEAGEAIAANAKVAARKSGEMLGDGTEYLAKKSGEAYEQSAEYLSEKGGELMGAASEKASDAASALKQTLQELPAHAGNTVTRFRDETGKLFERIASSTGDYYERYVEEPAQEAQRESRGLLGGLGDRLSHLGHSINGIFSGEGARAKHAGEQQYEYVRDAVGDYVLKPVQRAAESVKESLTPEQQSSKWAPYFDSREWKKYFGARDPADAAWWKQYLSGSDIDPRSWREYVQAYSGGPSQLERYWKSAKRAGRSAGREVADKYYDAKSATFSSLESGKSAFAPAPAAPVSLFWTAMLAMYLLVLAKRIFEQRRSAGHPDAVQQSRVASNSKVDEISEKVRLSEVAVASSDSLSTFAIYAPSTAVLLLAHELNNTLPSAIYYHAIYVALFAGQVLQNEVTLVRDPKARGLGMYLSWAAAGAAGVAGLLKSLGSF